MTEFYAQMLGVVEELAAIMLRVFGFSFGSDTGEFQVLRSRVSAARKVIPAAAGTCVAFCLLLLVIAVVNKAVSLGASPMQALNPLGRCTTSPGRGSRCRSARVVARPVPHRPAAVRPARHP